MAAQTEIEFHLAGAAILTEDGGPVTFLRVIHSGAVDIIHNGRLLDLLGTGDAFGHAAMLSGLPPAPISNSRCLTRSSSGRATLTGIR